MLRGVHFVRLGPVDRVFFATEPLKGVGVVSKSRAIY